MRLPTREETLGGTLALSLIAATAWDAHRYAQDVNSFTLIGISRDLGVELGEALGVPPILAEALELQDGVK